jgi:hypothetical protein
MHPAMHEWMSLMSPSNNRLVIIPDVPEELREKALKRTAEVLRKLDEVRKSLELPVEQLPIVIEMYNKVAVALLAERDREEMAKHTQRLPVTMRSETRDYEPLKIKSAANGGKPFEVVVRPQFAAFRPEDFAIKGDRSRWLVHDIKVGNRSQFLAHHPEPVPGTEFGPNGVLEHLRLETVQTAMDLAICVEYIGPEPEGEVFEATVVGTAFTL